MREQRWVLERGADYGPEANLLRPRIRLPYLKNIYLSTIQPNGADDLDDPLAAEGLGVRERHHRHGEEREE